MKRFSADVRFPIVSWNPRWHPVYVVISSKFRATSAQNLFISAQLFRLLKVSTYHDWSFLARVCMSLRWARKEFPAAPLREAIRDSDMGVAIKISKPGCQRSIRYAPISLPWRNRKLANNTGRRRRPLPVLHTLRINSAPIRSLRKKSRRVHLPMERPFYRS